MKRPLVGSLPFLSRGHLIAAAHCFWLMTFLVVSCLSSAAQDGWLDPGWTKQAAFVVSNPGPDIANYQVQIALDAANFDFGAAQSDGSDLRVTGPDGVSQLAFWIEDWDTANARATVWVKVPSLGQGQSMPIYLYYGNPTASSESDGASTFAFYDGFEGPFDSAPLPNAPQPLTTVVSARGGGTIDQVVHPGIVYFPSPWHGWEYWLVVTPYPGGNDYYENPSILVSHDGQSWQEPAGIVNPIALPDQSYLADADLFYNQDTDELWVYYPHQEVDGSTIYMIRRTSKDGVHWGPQLENRSTQSLFTVPDYNALSPAVVKVGATYWMWTVNTGSTGCGSPNNQMEYRTSSDGIHWSSAQPTNFPPPGYAYTPWHPDVIYVPSKGEFWAVVASYPHDSCNDTVLLFIKSTDGINWTTYNEGVPSIVEG